MKVKVAPFGFIIIGGGDKSGSFWFYYNRGSRTFPHPPPPHGGGLVLSACVRFAKNNHNATVNQRFGVGHRPNTGGSELFVEFASRRHR